MGNWRDPVDGRDFELPPRPKKKTVLQKSEQADTATFSSIPLTPILSGLSVLLMCIVIVLSMSISSQIKEIENHVEETASSAFVFTQAPVFTPIMPTATEMLSLQLPDIIRREHFSDLTTHSISLEDGELLVGTAMKFAIRFYNCNTVDVNENNTPYTIFLIRGPIEADIEISNGDWEYWTEVYDDDFSRNLLEIRRDEVMAHPNYLITGHIECTIPSFR